ncbi:MAG: hypothetical protein RL745_835, partial [Actinomycetota bacterium]
DPPDDALSVLSRQATDMGAAAASHAAAMVSDALGELRGAMAPRLQMELLCARLLAPGLGGGIDALASRVDDIQRRLDGLPAGVSGMEAARAAAANARQQQPAAAPASSAAESAPDSVKPAAAKPAVETSESSPRTQAAPTPPASTRKAPPPISKAASAPPPVVQQAPAVPAPTAEVDAPVINSSWSAVMDAVRADSRVVWALLSGATPMSVQGSTVHVGLPNDNLARTATSRDAHLALAAAIARVCGCAATVVLGVSAHAAGDAEAATASDATDTGGARIDDADAGAPPNSIDIIANVLGGTVLEEFDQSDG